MSFILDALKKSEHERQRQSMPGLVESVTVKPRSGLPVWAIAVFALLGINLVVLLVVLMRGRLTGSGGEPPPTAHGAPPVAAMPPADKPFSPLDAAPVYAPEIPVPAAPQAASTAPAIRQPASDEAFQHSPRHHEPVLNSDDFKADDEEVLPSINEISLTGDQALPDLHLDVHVYATKASERFVFINMRKYHEGATLQEGPSVERIRRDGVILNSNGLRFLLPRQ